MRYLDSDPVRLTDDGCAVSAIDQTLLPHELRRIELRTAEEFSGAIKRLAVRGAPCIGICAAYGIYVCSLKYKAMTGRELAEALKADAEIIGTARPTAVDLSWAVKRMMRRAGDNSRLSGEALTALLRAEAEAIHEENISICERISEHGLTLLKDGSSVITHCNAGGLATSRLGTGLGPLILGAQRGMKFRAFVDETRPLLQGARLTAWELRNAGVEVTLMCDNMAAYLMSKGGIDACMVGCDRVAANGDTANKIGTLGLAIAAKRYGVPFYVFCPSSTIDVQCRDGRDIEIEEREGSEISRLHFERPTAPEGIGYFNPAFDVTPAELITAIITEAGVFFSPSTQPWNRAAQCGSIT
ncbi:MAG: S-methyl-5-thioribose-1-phosphate isomerase [Ruminococcus sp.]|nr:S-methyl-5-thioribose-1-phosphate isomerase [Ruminococcus sp.]